MQGRTIRTFWAKLNDPTSTIVVKPICTNWKGKRTLPLSGFCQVNKDVLQESYTVRMHTNRLFYVWASPGGHCLQVILDSLFKCLAQKKKSLGTEQLEGWASSQRSGGWRACVQLSPITNRTISSALTSLLSLWNSLASFNLHFFLDVFLLSSSHKLKTNSSCFLMVSAVWPNKRYISPIEFYAQNILVPYYHNGDLASFLFGVQS